MRLVGRFVSVDFKDADGVRGFLHPHREDAEDAGFLCNGLRADVAGCLKIRIQIFRQHFNLRDAVECFSRLRQSQLRFVFRQSEKPQGVSRKDVLFERRKFRHVIQRCRQASQSRREGLRCGIRKIGAIEQTVRRRDGQECAESVRQRCTRKVIVKPAKIRLEIDLTDQAVCLHHGSEGLHPRQSKGQICAAVGDHHSDVRMPCQHVPRYHVADGARGLGKIFLHGKGSLAHHLPGYWLGTVGMQDDHGLAFIQNVH